MKSKSEQILQELGRIAREENPSEDVRWDALAAGKLSPEDEDALRSWAKAAPAAGEAYEVFRPMSAAEIDVMTAEVLARTDAAPPKEPQASGGGGGVVIPLRRKLRMLIPIAGALCAAAAAFVLFLQGPELVPVPDYEMSLNRGDLSQRSVTAADDGIPRYAPGSRVELLVRPAQPVQGEVAVRTALVGGGQARPWEPPVSVSPEGVASIEGRREEVFPNVPDGEWEIWLAIGRREALPEVLPPKTAPADKEAVRVLHQRVVLKGSPH